MKKLESFLKNILLRILLFLKRRKPDPSKVHFNTHSKILFIRLNRIGDALVTTPLIKEVKEKLGCQIDILADQKNHFIFANNPHVDNIFIFQKGFYGFQDALKIMGGRKYDAVVDLHDDISATVSFLLAFCQCYNIFGFSKGNDHVYTKTVPRPDPRTTHVVDRLLALEELFSIQADQNSHIIYCVNERIKTKVHNSVIKRFPDKRFLLGINISAGSDARFWGINKYIQLHKTLSAYDIDIVFLCSTRDIKLAMAITNDKEKIFYSPSFDEFSAMISELDMLFTPDTSVIHIASAFNIPLFGLYVKYNTNDMIWSPYKSDYDFVVTEEPNLHNISLDQVIIKFIPFLEKYIKK